MSLTTCKTCKAQIAKNAKTCPQCGAEGPPSCGRQLMSVGCLLIILSIAIPLLLVALGF